MNSNLSPQFNGKYLYVGHANGPSHKIDYTGEGYDDDPDTLPSWSANPATARIYHSSNHQFSPGETVNPTMSLKDSAYSQGFDEDEVEERFGKDDELQAWASFHPKFVDLSHTYEVEPLDLVHKRHDVLVDPHNTELNEMASPTGYRVVQEVTPKKTEQND